MELNGLLIKKIESILELSNKFDKICSSILSASGALSDTNIQNIKELTSIYMSIRTEHGAIIILNDKLKNGLNNKDSNSSKLINQLYDLSTFTSITENINNLVSNVDFEFKKIAMMYPKMISKNHTNLILFVKKIDAENKYVKIIEEIKKQRPENNYHVIECNKEGKKIDCSKMIGVKLSINVEKLPSLYLINDNIVDLPLERINSVDDLLKIIE